LNDDDDESTVFILLGQHLNLRNTCTSNYSSTLHTLFIPALKNT